MNSLSSHAHEEREKLKFPERVILGLIGGISLLGGVVLTAQFFDSGGGTVATLTGIIGLIVAALALVVCLLALGIITPYNADSENMRRMMRKDAQTRRDRDLNKQVTKTIAKKGRIGSSITRGSASSPTASLKTGVKRAAALPKGQRRTQTDVRKTTAPSRRRSR